MEISFAALTNLYYKISMVFTLRHRYESTFFGAETFQRLVKSASGCSRVYCTYHWTW